MDAEGRLLEDIPPIARTLAGLGLVGLVLLLLHLAAPVLVPVMFAFFLAALAMPVFGWLQARGLRRGTALFLLIAGLLAGGVALVLLALAAIGHLQAGLSTYQDQLAARLADLQAALAGAGVALPGLSDQSGAAASVLKGLLGAILSVASTALVSLVIVAFFLIESQRFMRIVQGEAERHPLFLGQVPRLAHTAVQYFGIRTRLNLLTGLGVVVVCLLLRVDYALLWGAVAFVLSYVPYIGLATAMVPPALLALAEGGWLRAAIVVIAITAMNLTIENVVEPAYTGKRLQLSPTIVFMSFFFWAWLLGPVGALLSMPITVMLWLVFQADDSTRWMADMIGREG
jgi:predicted PurR-regulated permease PerM